MPSVWVNDNCDVTRTDPVRNQSLLKDLRVAVVHHWFRSFTGAERVVAAILELFPQADLFGLIAHKEGRDAFYPRPIKTSFLQRLPGSSHFHRYLLPLYPIALEQFNFDNYDLVISSESGPAKGIITPAHVCHICYCHSPMRYVWDLHHQYVNGKDMAGFSRLIFRLCAHYIRLWDVASAQRVDYFVANSHNTAQRIRKTYRRDATVIHPPVRVENGYIANKIGDYYLIVGRLVDYKRVDLAIEACEQLGRPLHIVGTGPQFSRLKKLARGSTRFLGSLTDEQIRTEYAHCRALLFPAHEDFGMVPVEAHSFGRPVIAYARGGALETVRGPMANKGPVDSTCSGIFFEEQTTACLLDAIGAFEEGETNFSPHEIAATALRFSVETFKTRMAEVIAQRYNDFLRSGLTGPV